MSDTWYNSSSWQPFRIAKDTGKKYDYGAPVWLSRKEVLKTDTFKRHIPNDLVVAGWTARQHRVTTYTDSAYILDTPQNEFHLPVSGAIPITRVMPLTVEEPETYLDGRMRQKIRGEVVNLAQDFIEYRQACSMFSSFAKDVYSTFRNLRKGVTVQQVLWHLTTGQDRVSKGIANRWLEAQYGWKPLVSDIFGAIEKLEDKVFSDTDHRLKRCSKTIVEHYSGARQNGLGEWYTFVEDHQWEIHLKAIYRISSADYARAAQYGITNPALLVWELIPYSFVVDWLIPVGGWLESLDALTGIELLGVFPSHKLTVSTTLKYNDVPVTHHMSETSRNGKRLTLDLPRLTYKPSTSWKAVANGLALLRQLR